MIAAALAATAMFGCAKKEDESDIYIPIRTGNSVNYDTVHATVGTLLEQAALDAGFGTPYNVGLSFTRTGGTVASVEVHEDQEVLKGDVIATLDPTELEDDIVVQELTLNSAKSTYENLQKQRASADDIEFARIAYEIEQYKYDNLVGLRESLSLTAPFDGRIVSLGNNCYVGAHVEKYDTLCTISDSSRVCLTATDRDGRLSNVGFGTRVDITQGELVSTYGKVIDTITSQRFDRETGEMRDITTYVIQCDEEGVEFSELGGIQVIFTTLRRDDAVIVPSDAVFEAIDDSTNSTSNFVNVLMNGIKVQTPVTVGVVSGDKTEILSGLDGSETLIMP